MTVAEVLGSEELRQREFPVTRKMAFFGHAGACALPRRVAEAMKGFLENATSGDQATNISPRFIPDLREKAGKLVGCTSDEIAFVGPTSMALSFVAGGLKFRKTDNVVIYQDDYPSNVYPWMPLGEKGVEVRYLNIRELGRIRTTDVTGQVDENTRLVALSSCHFLAGWRIDLDAIGSFLRERGILFCIDGIQTVGAFPTSLKYVDFMAAGAHKWMLGPCGPGILYVRKEVQDQLLPTMFGWHNVMCPNFVAQEEMVLRKDARRYEAGTANLAGMAGMSAAIDMLLEVGVENIAAELLRKRAWVVPELQKKGFTVLQADAPADRHGAMISFFKDRIDLAALHARLLEENILTSLRADRSGRKLLRISPHFYNSDEELRRFLDALGD